MGYSFKEKKGLRLGLGLESVAAEPCGPCGPVAHTLFPLCGHGPPTFGITFFFFLLVTTEIGHVGGLPDTHNVNVKKKGTQKKMCQS